MNRYEVVTLVIRKMEIVDVRKHTVKVRGKFHGLKIMKWVAKLENEILLYYKPV
jgi:hypothetical protein